MRFFKNKKVITLIVLIVIIVTVGIIWMYKNSSNQTVVYNTSPDLSKKFVGLEMIAGYEIPLESLSQLLINTDLVIIGKVISDSVDNEKDININDEAKRKFESKSNKKLMFAITQAQIRIEKIIYGNSDLKEITFNQLGKAGSDRFQTKAKKGEKMLLLLRKSDAKSTYASVNFEDGMFKINNDGKILSLSKKMAVAKYDGLDIGILEQDIIKESKNIIKR